MDRPQDFKLIEFPASVAINAGGRLPGGRLPGGGRLVDLEHFRWKRQKMLHGYRFREAVDGSPKFVLRLRQDRR